MNTVIWLICVLSLFMLVTSEHLSKQSYDINYKRPNAFHMVVKQRPQHCLVKSQKGDLIHVHYRGTLEDGTEFDSSYPRGNPLTFRLGSQQVIQGFEKGLNNMCIGESRRLIVGSDYAYGSKGAPPKIPPHTTLYFDVELVNIERHPGLDELLNEKVVPGPPDPPKTDL